MAFKPIIPFYVMLRAITLLCLFESFISILLVLKGIQTFQFHVHTVSPSVTADDNLWKKAYFQAYITYFRGCNMNSSFQIYSNSTYENYPIRRTFYWLIFYLIFNGLWVITSALLSVVHVFKNDQSKRPRKYLYYPWILTFAIIIFADTLASIQYLLDFSGVHDIESYQDFTGCSFTSEQVKYFTDGDENFLNMGPIMMSLLFSRGIIIWLVNVIAFVQFTKYFNGLQGENQSQQKLEDSITSAPASAPELKDLQRTLSKTLPWNGDDALSHASTHYLKFSDPVPQTMDYGSTSMQMNRMVSTSAPQHVIPDYKSKT